MNSSPRTFKSPFSPQRAAAWCSVTRTINVSGQRRPTLARSTQSSCCTRSRNALKSTVMKPGVEPLGHGGFDLNRRDALERAFDLEVADGLIERELHALERAVERQRHERQHERGAQPAQPHGAERRQLQAREPALDSAAIRSATEHQRASLGRGVERLADDAHLELELHAARALDGRAHLGDQRLDVGGRRLALSSR